ncbi:hypothetical protein GCM10022393_32770 [Aquimarina addita]|uniref:Uncharacterized protein n=1 Tax=Aquimarina addita TaxID=870485 RepID=A0ABP6UP52_9FLAO
MGILITLLTFISFTALAQKVKKDWLSASFPTPLKDTLFYNEAVDKMIKITRYKELLDINLIQCLFSLNYIKVQLEYDMILPMLRTG